MSSLDARLGKAIQDRTELASQVSRLSGRLDAAKSNLEAIDAECQALGVDPDQLGPTISKLEDQYTKLVVQLETGVREAAEALAPYLSESE